MKFSTLIVDKRKGFYLVFILLIAYSILSMNKVKVNNDLTSYLPDSTETRQGLDQPFLLPGNIFHGLGLHAGSPRPHVAGFLSKMGMIMHTVGHMMHFRVMLHSDSVKLHLPSLLPITTRPLAPHSITGSCTCFLIIQYFRQKYRKSLPPVKISVHFLQEHPHIIGNPVLKYGRT